MRCSSIMLWCGLMLLAGCGGDSSEVESVPVGEQPVTITVASGGRLQSADGQLVVLIPEQALSQDTAFAIKSLTVAGYKDADQLLSGGYQVSPESLQLAKSMELIFNHNAAGEPRALYRLSNGRWHKIQLLSAVAGQTGKLSGKVLQSGTYALGLAQLPEDIVHIEKGPSCQLGQGPHTVSLTHVADLHARYHVSRFAQTHDGHHYAKIKAFANARAQLFPYSLFTGGGDDYEKGSIAEELSQGKATRLATFAMGFDVRVMGNHDFAWGEQEMLAFSDDPTAVTLASNTQYFGANPSDFKSVPYVEYELGCVRIGIIGLVGDAWDEFDDEQKRNHLPNFATNQELVTAANDLVTKYRSRVDYLVMLNHLRVDQDIAIAQAVPGVDLILGGHAHRGYKLWQNGSMLLEQEYVDDLRGQIRDLQAQLVNATEGEKFFIQQQIDKLQAQVDVLLPALTARQQFTSQLDKPFVVQPGHYGDAMATIELQFSDEVKPKLQQFALQIVETEPLTARDSAVDEQIAELISDYVPANDAVIAVTEQGYQNSCVGLNALCDPENVSEPIEQQRAKASAALNSHIVQLVGKAVMATQPLDAALLDPNVANPYNRMLREQTSVTVQDLYRSYFVERQPADSPGFNSLYSVIVTGSQLQTMRSRQPYWLYLGPENPVAGSLYKVALHKAAALNLQDARVFGANFGAPVASASFIAETWQVMKAYAYQVNCQYLDTGNGLLECEPLNSLSIWQFADAGEPLKASVGSGTLSYADPNSSDWELDALKDGSLAFASASSFGIAPVPGGDKTVMKFKGFAKDEGLLLRHNAKDNGYFQYLSKLSQYTLLMDLYLPSASLPPANLNGVVLLQSNVANTDTPDIRLDDSFSEQDNAYRSVVVFSDYIGYKKIDFKPDTWHRLAITMNANANNLLASVYLDGELQFSYDNGQCYMVDPNNGKNINVECYRFALDSTALLLASSSSSRRNGPGYLANVLFTGRELSAREIASLGGASVHLAAPKSVIEKP